MTRVYRSDPPSVSDGGGPGGIRPALRVADRRRPVGAVREAARRLGGEAGGGETDPRGLPDRYRHLDRGGLARRYLSLPTPYSFPSFPREGGISNQAGDPHACHDPGREPYRAEAVARRSLLVAV